MKILFAFVSLWAILFTLSNAQGADPSPGLDLSAISGASEIPAEREKLVRHFEKLASEAPPKEAAILRKILPKLKKLDQSDESLGKVFLAMGDMIAELMRLYAKDAKLQATYLGQLSVTAESLSHVKGFEKKGEERKQESLLKTASAVKRFPKEPTIHLAHGLILRRAGKLKEAAEAYRRCAELDPQNTDCKENLSLLERERKVPRCRAGNVQPGLSLFIAEEKKTEGYSTEAQWEGKSLFLKEVPVWTGKDVALIEEEDAATVSLDLAPAAAETFRSATQNATGKYAVLMLDKSVLLGAIIRGAITDGRMRIELKQADWKDKSTLPMNRLCQKIEF